ncbi:MAG: efflux RND transporter permease subunit [Oceanospirillaceae bacterium]|nr:efflux RND transporter permease subunit [Oceanospirillaceae bacterium]
MIEWFTKNHVAANLLMLAIIIGGVFSLKTRIPLEVFPSFESNVISTSVSLTGATALEVEESITLLIEQQVSDLEGIESITSYSSEGRSVVNMEVNDNYDKRDLLADVKSKIDTINDFPADADAPVTQLSQHRREVISVSVSGDVSEQIIHTLGEKIRDELLQLTGITQVELERVRDYQLSIVIKQQQLRRFDLTLSEISNAIANSSVNTSAGNLRTNAGDILISTNGKAFDIKEFSKIIVKTTADGVKIRLAQIAKLTDGFEETALRTRFNGKNAALIEVYRVGDQSALAVANTVKQYIADTRSSLAPGITLSHWRDGSKVLKSRLKTLIDNAIQGGILIIVMLSLFLRPSVAFFVFLGIPISFMGAFIVMPLLGVSLNIISLFGFILVLGIVVDDAIVTGENIYSHMQRAESGIQAAIFGTKEVAVAVTFGVLTTVAAFLPFAFIEGQRGAIFAQIPAVVIPVLLFSLIESKFILPAHLKFMRLRHNDHKLNIFSRFQQRFADGFEKMILKQYQPLLRKALHHRYSVLVSFIGLFVLLVAFVSSGWMKFTFFPRVPSEVARVTLTMPTGTPFSITDAHVKRMVDAALTLQEKYRNQDTGESIILDILSTTGSGGGASHRGRVSFETLAPDARGSADDKVPMGQLVKQWRQMIGPISGATSLTYRAEIGRGGDPVSVQISGESMTQMRLAAADIRTQLNQYPGVFDITDTLSDGKDELQIELKVLGQILGVSRASLINQIRQAMQGIEVQSFQRGREEVPVVVILPLSERDSIADLNNLEIKIGERRIPLGQLAHLSIVEGPSTLYRTDYIRTANVVADINKSQVNATLLNTDLRTFLDEIKQGKYPKLDFSLRGEAREQSRSFGSLQWGLVFVFFAIYALLAIPFQSFTQPLIVMSVIPFGAIGAVFGHWVMGMDLTIMSLLGLLALIGVVVNDSLVLVTFVNQKVTEGSKVRAAVLTAGVARFRPVILTSITTFAGLLPLLFEQATQAQFLIPMAVSLSFGILFATAITLVLIPVNYLIIEDLKNKFGRS